MSAITQTLSARAEQLAKELDEALCVQVAGEDITASLITTLLSALHESHISQSSIFLVGVRLLAWARKVGVTPRAHVLIELTHHFERLCLQRLAAHGQLSLSVLLTWRERLSSLTLALSELLSSLESAEPLEASPSPAALALNELAFGEGAKWLHQPLTDQLSVRLNKRSALSAVHLYVLESDAPSWWRASARVALSALHLDVIELRCEEGEPWGVSERLARALLEREAVQTWARSPEAEALAAILQLWCGALSGHSEALAWLERLTPPSRQVWLKRALKAALSAAQGSQRLLVWLEGTERLEEGEALFLSELLTERGGRGVGALMVAQHSEGGTLPEAFASLSPAHTSPLPQRDTSELLTPHSLEALFGEGEPFELAALWLTLRGLAQRGEVKREGELWGVKSEGLGDRRALSGERGQGVSERAWVRLWGALLCTLSEQSRVEASALSALHTLQLKGSAALLNSCALTRCFTPQSTPQSTPKVWLPYGLLSATLEVTREVEEGVRQVVQRQLDRATALFEEGRVGLTELARLWRALGEEARAEALTTQAFTRACWWGEESAGERALSSIQAQSALARGEALWLSGALGEAEAPLSEALGDQPRSNPAWARARVSLGALCLSRGEGEEAGLFLREALEREGGGIGPLESARALTLLGLNAHVQGASEEAVRALRGAWRLCLSSGEVTLQPIITRALASLAFEEGALTQALSLSREASEGARELRWGGLETALCEERAKWWLELGALDHARAELRARAERGPLTAHTHQLRGRLALAEGAWREALEGLTQREGLTLEGGLEANVFRALALVSHLEERLEAEGEETLSVHEREGLTRELMAELRAVRLNQASDEGLLLLARYVELRLSVLKGRLGITPSDEVRAQLEGVYSALRAEWGVRHERGALPLSHALCYTLCGVEVGVSAGSPMEVLTELELLKPYLKRWREALSALRLSPAEGERWELSRLKQQASGATLL